VQPLRSARRPALAGALVAATVVGALAASQNPEPGTRPTGTMDAHPAIQYATRQTTDRVTRLNQALAAGTAALRRDAQTGYLKSLLATLDVPLESQLLVFSKTGAQRAITGPLNPRALFFDESVAVGYVPGAQVVEIAAHDPQQGIVFYTLDQTADAAAPVRRTSCLTCHVSRGTLEVPGLIARSHVVGDDGNPLTTDSVDVDHKTGHPDRWGGWFVTQEGAPAPYSQRGHEGNITFSPTGSTSNQVFIDWMNSAPEQRGYVSRSSDIVSLLVFDHQAHAINLLTRLNWEMRISSSAVGARVPQELVHEIADYLLFVGEVPPSVPLTPRAGFAAHLASKAPKDQRGRSLAQMDLDKRLFRYPCSYLVYSAAFDGLEPVARAAIYDRMLQILSGRDASRRYESLLAADRSAVLEILRDTKPDFPRD
jgi:hypothetical protein